MNIKQHLGSLFVMAAAALTLHAQVSGDVIADASQAYPPPPYYSPGYTPPYTPGYNGYRPDLPWAAAVTLPYAFNWNAAGVVGEVGRIVEGQNFVGGEIGYYGGSPQRYDVYNGNTRVGSFHSSQDITTIDFAYRYYEPLDRSGPFSPLSLYIGASAGVGFVNYSNDGSTFGFHNDNKGAFTGDALAGLQFNSAPTVAFRLGYRYIFVSDAWRLNRHVDLDSGAVEASVAFRF